jgi:hypothetical protein
MPRTLDPMLRQALERSNPNVGIYAEITAPDVGLVLRRWEDQFSVNPPRVSESPAASSISTPSGGLTIAQSASPTAIAQRTANNAQIGVTSDEVKVIGPALMWTPDQGLKPVTLRRFIAHVKKTLLGGLALPLDWQLQIYRPRAIVGTLTRQQGTSTIIQDARQWTFEKQLPTPAIWKYDVGAWPAGTAEGDISFDLTPYNYSVHGFAPSPPTAGTIDLPYLLFVVQPVRFQSFFAWRVDSTTAITTAGIGKFQQLTWTKSTDPNKPDDWIEGTPLNQAPMFQLFVNDYQASTQEVYAIDLGAVPSTPTVGRIEFEAPTPSDTTSLLELSTAGSGGPWTAVKHHDVVGTKQQTYHLRVTLTRSTDHQRAPVVNALGVAFRTPFDVSLESNVGFLRHEVNVPFLAASIGEGNVRVLRTGRRDFGDVASTLGANYPTSRLEADLFLSSTHPSIGRDKWFLVDRALVTSRTPTPTSEAFPLLSPLKQLKRKIPARVEAISTVHVVQSGTTASAVIVLPALPLTTAPSGNEYDNKKYYLRVRSSTQVGVETGNYFTIAGNTGTGQLDFSPAMPGTLIAGDVVEVHSGTFAQPLLEWIDEDPAVIWWEILTIHLGIPNVLIGRGDLGRAGRAGLPPKVTDRAPGDATTQAKLKVTFKSTKEEGGDAMIDQLSFLMGGVTTEIGGQVVFRQMYELVDADGTRVSAPESPACVFDPRDYYGLDTPTGVEQRLTTVACNYGVDPTLASDQQATHTVVFSDGDAVAWLATQDVEGLGTATIPDEIARWCFNSADQGLLLATMLTSQVARAASTGLRQWSWQTTDAHPELCVGDVVTIITDQYTDYDPTRQASIRGMWAYPLVLISVGDGGRTFRGFMLGLHHAVPIVGGTGTLTALPVALTLDVTPTETTTTYEFAYVTTGTSVEYRVDGGSWVTAGASPVIVARNASGGLTKQVQFRTTAGIQLVTVGPFNVPAQASSPPARAFTGAEIADSGVSYDGDTQSIDWFVTGFVSGDYFIVERQTTDNGVVTESWTAHSSPTTATGWTDELGAQGYDLIPSGGVALVLEYRVQWYDSGDVNQATSAEITINRRHA